MAWRILISSLHMRLALDHYSSEIPGDDIEWVLAHGSQALSEQEMLRYVDESIDGIICSDDAISKKVMDRAPRLKVISKWGVGINSIDREAAAQRGIQIFNSPGAFDDSVADFVMAGILHFARNITEQDRRLRQGEWVHHTGMLLKKRRLGIVGVGNIGRAVARRAAAFGMVVCGTDIRPVDPHFLAEVPMAITDLNGILQTSDFVSLHCDLNPTSFHLMGPPQFQKMKPDAILVNTSRGPVVDEKALVGALQTRAIAGAVLDVFEQEPLPASSPLRSMDHVLLSPHDSYNGDQAVDFVHRNTLRNMIEGLRNVRQPSPSQGALP